ncbi:unnamed protein product [Meloidogyne enterolobii]|uniref:Uncharacterized protein n=1 Tax=Meloidogyne enterolobii TaxID=390850 RepID=A0ACB0Z4G4_MELEN
MMWKALFSSFNSKAVLFFTFFTFLLPNSNSNSIRIREESANPNSADLEELLYATNKDNEPVKSYTITGFVNWTFFNSSIEVPRSKEGEYTFLIMIGVDIFLVIFVLMFLGYVISKCFIKFRENYTELLIQKQANETQMETRGLQSYARSLALRGIQTKMRGRRQLRAIGRVSNLSRISIFEEKGFGKKKGRQTPITLSVYEKLSDSLREGLPVPPGFKKGKTVESESNTDQKPALTISEYEKLSNSLREGVPIPKGFEEIKLSITPVINNKKTPVIQQQTKIQPNTKSSPPTLPQATKNKNNVKEEAKKSKKNETKIKEEKNTKKESKRSETIKTIPKLESKKVSQKTSENSKEEKKTVKTLIEESKPKTLKKGQKNVKTSPIVENKKKVTNQKENKISTSSSPKVEKKTAKSLNDEQKVKTSKVDKKATTKTTMTTLTPKKEQKEGGKNSDKNPTETATPKKNQKTKLENLKENKNISVKTFREEQKIEEEITPKEFKKEEEIQKEERNKTKLVGEEEENSTTTGSLSD